MFGELTNLNKVLEEIQIDDQDVIEEIVRLSRENCWGCTSNYSAVSRYSSAHQNGYGVKKQQCVEWYDKEALFNLFANKNFGWNEEIMKNYKNHILQQWYDS